MTELFCQAVFEGFKNHLILLQGYASSDRLYEELAPTILIETPSAVLSAIINAKNEDCKRKGIHGLGIKSMTQSVEKLRGEMQIDYTMDTFHVNILMPNYK